MNDNAQNLRILPMSRAAIDRVMKLESFNAANPQVDIVTHHVLHAGMYARTITLPASVLLTGALIKIPTLLIINGDVVVYMDGEAIDLSGYNVFAASAHRMQAFYAKTSTDITMIFPTTAFTVEEAEREFTDDFEKLFSRKNSLLNNTTITGE